MRTKSEFWPLTWSLGEFSRLAGRTSNHGKVYLALFHRYQHMDSQLLNGRMLCHSGKSTDCNRCLSEFELASSTVYYNWALSTL